MVGEDERDAGAVSQLYVDALSLGGFGARPKAVTARDLAGGEERDVSAACGFAEGRLVVEGRLLASISSPTDLSDPAALLRIHA